jgi:hypothetical protein
MSKETAPLVHGDPALAGYFPAWINDLAEDVVLEGSAMNGVIQGADAVPSVHVHPLPVRAPGVLLRGSVR